MKDLSSRQRKRNASLKNKSRIARVLTSTLRSSAAFSIQGRSYVVDFDENYYFKDTDTTRGVIERLSRESLDRYNNKMAKCFEFVEVIKANTHPTGTAADMFYITFRAKEPSDDHPKDFQAMVCYFCYTSNKYHSCQLKPEKKVHSIEPAEKEDAKKIRLAEQLSVLVLPFALFVYCVQS
ncbi:Uncharacterized protein Rs2_42330 [Raphanus sativus]|nr:Uncharacterized protein Rs2_42330 [Raphanus sativus]